jgi:hypothetical protein
MWFIIICSKYDNIIYAFKTIHDGYIGLDISVWIEEDQMSTRLSGEFYCLSDIVNAVKGDDSPPQDLDIICTGQSMEFKSNSVFVLQPAFFNVALSWSALLRITAGICMHLFVCTCTCLQIYFVAWCIFLGTSNLPSTLLQKILKCINILSGGGLRSLYACLVGEYNQIHKKWRFHRGSGSSAGYVYCLQYFLYRDFLTNTSSTEL